MLAVVLAVGCQDDGEKKHGIGEQVDGSTTDRKGEWDEDQVGETLGESGHDREVEEVLIVLALLDDVFVFEERDDRSECGDCALPETGDYITGRVSKMERQDSMGTCKFAT